MVIEAESGRELSPPYSGIRYAMNRNRNPFNIR
jgi:hypothetical protein